eukprot:5744500-Ditylum_brightwellii.AAC.1
MWNKNFDFTHTLRDYGFGHLGLTDLGRNWSAIPNRDRPPAQFQGHFHKGKLAITSACNVHDKISVKFQVGGAASIATGNLVGRLDKKGDHEGLLMALHQSMHNTSHT